MPSRKRSIFELIQDVSIKTKTAIFLCTACNNIIYQGLLSFGSPDPSFGPYFPKKMKVRKYGQIRGPFTTFDEILQMILILQRQIRGIFLNSNLEISL